MQAGQAGVQAGQVGQVEVQAGQAGRAGRVGQVAGPTGLPGLPGQAILVLAVGGSGAVATGLLGQANLAGHRENHRAGRLGIHLAPVLESHRDTGPTGSWPGRKPTCGHD